MNMRIAHYCRAAWDGMRAVLGDDAYERYLEHVRRHHAGCVPMSRGEFYRLELERRWSQVNRCC